jgi:hypothetical protein
VRDRFSLVHPCLSALFRDLLPVYIFYQTAFLFYPSYIKSHMVFFSDVYAHSLRGHSRSLPPPLMWGRDVGRQQFRPYNFYSMVFGGY